MFVVEFVVEFAIAIFNIADAVIYLSVVYEFSVDDGTTFDSILFS